ncbi:DNA mismatch repair endonuclease MutL [Thermostilla marina]
MPKIRRLSQSLINKIAAGEVVERPASVVKELLENALDAGSTRIDISVEKGGTQLVRVADNGCGISADDLPLAVASHATSKLDDVDDLFHVTTLGFRGEALASISEVSRFRIRSRIENADSGYELTVIGGSVGEVVPCGCPKGTVIEVRDLFYNTPVRRKFLRSVQTELGHITDIVARLALGHPNVHVTLAHNDRVLFNLPPVDSPLERIGALYGEALVRNLVEVGGTDGDVRVWGYVGLPQESRSNTKMQILLLNGRPIRDRALQHALQEAYRGLLLTGRYPVAFLWLEIPPDAVDVNVHPTKAEVRFLDGGRLYAQVLSALRTRFLSTDLTARVDESPADEVPHDPESEQRHRQAVVDWAKGKLAELKGDESGSLSSVSITPPDERRPLTLTRLGRAFAEKTAAEKPLPSGVPNRPETLPRTDEKHETTGTSPTYDGDAAEERESVGRRPQALQIHNRYLVTENEDGVVIIDQHALHERILFEQLKSRIDAGPLESQGLLVPEPVDLDPIEAAVALEHGEVFESLGLKIEPFGGNTVLIVRYPALLAGMSPAEILRAAIQPLLNAGKTPDRRDLLDEILHMIACKAAIKAGDRLTPEEIDALLAQSHLVDDAHHCPHGRPTAVVFTRKELDKHFKRI